MFRTLLGQVGAPASAISPYNPLVVALVLLAAGATLSALFLFREARDSHPPSDRQSFAWLFGLVGAIALLVSGEIFWANWAGFPASQYTELFGVAQTLYAVVMLAAAFTIYHNLDPRPFAWMSAVCGLLLFQGARAIVSFDLTLSPAVSALIWVTAGLAAVVVLPASYAPTGSGTRRSLVYLGVLFAVVLAAASLGMGLEAHYSHIAEAMG
ncbi:DUF981 family protein [Halarchaeum nitratireducens]|uniref:Uncharacterized protein n=1 Tax=Halarchaeum nitratireducens TaxID=489913 RepID=A0A830GDA0_9EURY|nr:DUF981 family protein [Halarchaeum nitratireducens]GGN23172.1 hypothetical protein GCM10009021_25960 [Halarchaeum nitratireducens]